MFNHIIGQVIEQYVQEFLGDWDPVVNLKIRSLTEPEINLTNVPLPQIIFDLAEIPFIVDYSNIARVHARFSWATFLGRSENNPLAINVEDVEIRLRFAYPSEWNADKWEKKLRKAKLKRAAVWQKFASVFATHAADKSISQSLECRIINSLKVRAKNIHVQLVDDHFSSVPFAFDIYIAEFNMDSPGQDDPRLSNIEKEGLYQFLLSALWMRFVGMHIFYKEFEGPVLAQRRHDWNDQHKVPSMNSYAGIRRKGSRLSDVPQSRSASRSSSLDHIHNKQRDHKKYSSKSIKSRDITLPAESTVLDSSQTSYKPSTLDSQGSSVNKGSKLTANNLKNKVQPKLNMGKGSSSSLSSQDHHKNSFVTRIFSRREPSKKKKHMRSPSSELNIGHNTRQRPCGDTSIIMSWPSDATLPENTEGSLFEERSDLRLSRSLVDLVSYISRGSTGTRGKSGTDKKQRDEVSNSKDKVSQFSSVAKHRRSFWKPQYTVRDGNNSEKKRKKLKNSPLITKKKNVLDDHKNNGRLFQNRKFYKRQTLQPVTERAFNANSSKRVKKKTNKVNQTRRKLPNSNKMKTVEESRHTYGDSETSEDMLTDSEHSRNSWLRTIVNDVKSFGRLSRKRDSNNQSNSRDSYKTHSSGLSSNPTLINHPNNHFKKQRTSLDHPLPCGDFLFSTNSLISDTEVDVVEPYPQHRLDTSMNDEPLHSEYLIDKTLSNLFSSQEIMYPRVSPVPESSFESVLDADLSPARHNPDLKRHNKQFSYSAEHTQIYNHSATYLNRVYNSGETVPKRHDSFFSSNSGRKESEQISDFSESNSFSPIKQSFTQRKKRIKSFRTGQMQKPKINMKNGFGRTNKQSKKFFSRASSQTSIFSSTNNNNHSITGDNGDNFRIEKLQNTSGKPKMYFQGPTIIASKSLRVSNGVKKWREKTMWKRVMAKESQSKNNCRFGTSGIKDILPPNDKAYRVTGHQGIEMHILFKKWEIRALSTMNLSNQRWKTVQLSFIPHKATESSPKSTTETTAKNTKDDNQYNSTTPPLGTPSPVYDGSQQYGPLSISFTAAALEAFFNFIKFLEIWFVFIRGCARPIRQDPTPELETSYLEIWKKKASGSVLTLEETACLLDLDDRLPLYAILSFREKAEAEVWGSLGLAGLARHFRGKVQGVCRGVFSIFGGGGGPIILRNNEKTWRPSPCCNRPTEDEKEEELFYEIKNSNETKLTENDFYWFNKDSYLEVIIPDLRCEIIPSATSGRHIQGTLLQPLSPFGLGPVFCSKVSLQPPAVAVQCVMKNQTFNHQPTNTNNFVSNFNPSFDGIVHNPNISQKMLNHQPSISPASKATGKTDHYKSRPNLSNSKKGLRNHSTGDAEYQAAVKRRMPDNAIAHLGAGVGFVFCCALRYIAEKTNDHTKNNRIVIDNILLVERPVEFLILPTPTAMERRYVHNDICQTPIPSHLIISQKIPLTQITVSVASIRDHQFITEYLNSRCATQNYDILSDTSLVFDDDNRWNPFKSSLLTSTEQASLGSNDKSFIFNPSVLPSSGSLDHLQKSDEIAPTMTMSLAQNITPESGLNEGSTRSKQSFFGSCRDSLLGSKSNNNSKLVESENSDLHETFFISGNTSRRGSIHYIKKPIVHPPSRLSVVIDEKSVSGVKKTLVAVPQCIVEGTRLLALASAFPPPFHVHRDLFETVDARIPSETMEAQNLGYFCAPTIRPLEIQISRVYVVVKSPIHDRFRASKLTALNESLTHSVIPEVLTGWQTKTALTPYASFSDALKLSSGPKTSSRSTKKQTVGGYDVLDDSFNYYKHQNSNSNLPFIATPPYSEEPALHNRLHHHQAIAFREYQPGFTVLNDPIGFSPRTNELISENEEQNNLTVGSDVEARHEFLSTAPLIEQVTLFAAGFNLLIAHDKSIAVSATHASLFAHLTDYLEFSSNVNFSDHMSRSVENGIPDNGLNKTNLDIPFEWIPEIDVPQFILFSSSIGYSSDIPVCCRKFFLTPYDGSPSLIQRGIKILDVQKFSFVKKGGIIVEQIINNGTRDEIRTSLPKIEDCVTVVDQFSSIPSRSNSFQQQPSDVFQHPLPKIHNENSSNNDNNKLNKTATKLEIGVETISFSFCHASLSLICGWKAFSFSNVDFPNILYRLKMFTSARKLDAKSLAPIPNSKFIWRPKLQMVDLGSFEIVSDYVSDKRELQKKFCNSVYGGVALVDFIDGYARQQTMNKLGTNGGVLDSKTSRSEDHIRDTIKLHPGLKKNKEKLTLEFAAGRVEILGFQYRTATFGLQLFSPQCRFVKSGPEKTVQFQVSETHFTHIVPLSELEYTSAVILTKNAAHVGLDGIVDNEDTSTIYPTITPSHDINARNEQATTPITLNLPDGSFRRIDDQSNTRQDNKSLNTLFVPERRKQPLQAAIPVLGLPPISSQQQAEIYTDVQTYKPQILPLSYQDVHRWGEVHTESHDFQPISSAKDKEIEGIFNDLTLHEHRDMYSVGTNRPNNSFCSPTKVPVSVNRYRTPKRTKITPGDFTTPNSNTKINLSFGKQSTTVPTPENDFQSLFSSPLPSGVTSEYIDSAAIKGQDDHEHHLFSPGEQLSPARTIIDKFGTDSVPQIAVTFTSIEPDALQKVFVELRSVYVFLSPCVLVTIIEMAKQFESFWKSESDRFRISWEIAMGSPEFLSDHISSDKGETKSTIVLSPTLEVENEGRSFYEGPSFISNEVVPLTNKQSISDNNLNQAGGDSAINQLVLRDTDQQSSQIRHFSFAVTLDHINIHPVYSRPPMVNENSLYNSSVPQNTPSYMPREYNKDLNSVPVVQCVKSAPCTPKRNNSDVFTCKRPASYTGLPDEDSTTFQNTYSGFRSKRIESFLSTSVGWPSVITVKQLENVSPDLSDTDGRSAVLDFDNIGLRITTSVEIDVTLTSTPTLEVESHSEQLLQRKTTSNAFFVASQASSTLNTWNDSFGRIQQQIFKKFKIDVKWRRLEINLLRNATWLISSVVIPQMEACILFWKEEFIDYNNKMDTVNRTAHIVGTKSNSLADINVQNEQQNNEKLQRLSNSFQKYKTKGLNNPHSPTYIKDAGGASWVSTFSFPERNTSLTYSESKKAINLDLVTLDIREVAIWHTSYWSSAFNVSVPRKSVYRRFSGTKLNKKTHIKELFPSPLSIGLVWAPQFLPHFLLRENKLFHAQAENSFQRSTDHTAYPSPVSPSYIQSQQNLHTPHVPNRSREVYNREGVCFKHDAFHENNGASSSFINFPYMPTDKTSLGKDGNNDYLTVEQQIALINKEPWCRSCSSLLFPSRQPFVQHFSNCRPILLPIFYYNAMGNTKKTDMESSINYGMIQKEGKDSHNSKMSMPQFSLCYSAKKHTSGNYFHHFVSCHMGPTTAVIEPHMLKSIEATIHYLKFWMGVVSQEMTMSHSYSEQFGSSTSISKHQTKNYQESDSEHGNEKFLQKLVQGTSAIAKVEKLVRKLSGNIYLDVQMDGFKTVVANVDAVVRAPKLNAELILCGLTSKLIEKYKRSVNGVAIQALQFFDVICLSQQSIPSATLKTCLAMQVVSTSCNDFFPVKYNSGAIASVFSAVPQQQHQQQQPVEHNDPLLNKQDYVESITVTPPLLSLISFGLYETPLVPHPPVPDENFFGISLHIPIFSVGLAISSNEPNNIISGWEGLIKTHQDVNSFPSDGYQVLPAYNNTQVPDKLYTNSDYQQEGASSSVLELFIGRLDAEIFKMESSGTISSSISVTQLSLRDALKRDFFRSTALLKRYFGSSRVSTSVNFNPLAGFPRLNVSSQMRLPESIGNQLDASLLFGPNHIWGGVELRSCRLEIEIESLELLNTSIRDLLQTVKDMKSLNIMFPELYFKGSNRSTAQVSTGFPELGFATEMSNSYKFFSSFHGFPNNNKNNLSRLSLKSPKSNSMLPPLVFRSRIPNTIRQQRSSHLYSELLSQCHKALQGVDGEHNHSSLNFPSQNVCVSKHENFHRLVQELKKDYTYNQNHDIISYLNTSTPTYAFIPTAFQLILPFYELPTFLGTPSSEQSEWTEMSDDEFLSPMTRQHELPQSAFQQAIEQRKEYFHDHSPIYQPNARYSVNLGQIKRRKNNKVKPFISERPTHNGKKKCVFDPSTQDVSIEGASIPLLNQVGKQGEEDHLPYHPAQSNKVTPGYSSSHIRNNSFMRESIDFADTQSTNQGIKGLRNRIRALLKRKLNPERNVRVLPGSRSSSDQRTANLSNAMAKQKTTFTKEPRSAGRSAVGDDVLSPSGLNVLEKSHWNYEPFSTDLTLEFDISIEAVEVWVWPLTPVSPEKQLNTQKTDVNAPVYQFKREQNKVLENRRRKNQKLYGLGDDDDLSDSATNRSSMTRSSHDQSVTSIDLKQHLYSHNVTHPRLIAVQRLQALTNNISIGHLSGGKKDRSPVQGVRPVTGLLMSFLGNVSKTKDSIKGQTHLVECNLMLGYPESPAPVPTGQYSDDNFSPMQRTSTSIPIQHPLTTKHTINANYSTSNYSPSNNRPGSTTFMRPGLPDNTKSSGVTVSLRGIRIRREHRRDFPPVLIGFGGAALVSNMSLKDRDDCLFTLNKILLETNYIAGPEIGVILAPNAIPQRHCYFNILIDQPQLHFSLDTLWSLDDLQRSIKQFIHVYIGQWKTDPARSSFFLIELGILYAVNRHLTALNDLSSHFKQNNRRGIMDMYLDPSSRYDTVTGAETTGMHLDTDQSGFPDIWNQDGFYRTTSDGDNNGNDFQIPMGDDNLSISETQSRISTPSKRSRIDFENLYGTYPVQHTNANDPKPIYGAVLRNGHIQPTSSSSFETSLMDRFNYNNNPFNPRLSLRGYKKTDDDASTNSLDIKHSLDPIYNNSTVCYNETIDHKLLRFLFVLCSFGEEQIPLHFSINIEDVVVNLHDAYVQLLQVRITNTNIKACLPLIKSSSITLNLLLGLTTYNPLISASEKVLDSVGLNLRCQRRIAGEVTNDNECPWLDISLQLDRLGLDISSGLLQILCRLNDLISKQRRGVVSLGKLKTVTIYNDTRAPIILLQRSGQFLINTSPGLIRWHDVMLYDKQCCTASIDFPIWFAIRRQQEKQLSQGTMANMDKSEIGMIESQEKGRKNQKRELINTLKANIETEEDIKRLGFEILKLGNSSILKELNDFLRAYQKPLLYGTTRSVEFILKLLADQLPTFSEGTACRGLLSPVGHIFDLLRTEAGWCAVGRLRADYQTQRAYNIPNYGYKVVIEPATSPSAGQWKLCVGTAIQIANTTNIPFKIFTSRRFGAVRRFARRLQGDGNEVSSEVKTEKNSPNCIIVEQHCRRSIPLSWFFNSRVPYILPILEEEKAESIYAKLGQLFSDGRATTDEDETKLHLDTFNTMESKNLDNKKETITNGNKEGFTLEKSSLQQLIMPQPFTTLQRLLTKLSGTDNDEAYQRHAVENLTIRFRRNMSWNVAVDVTDVPANAPYRIAYRYTIKISPYLTIQNVLPFPLTISLYPSRAPSMVKKSKLRRLGRTTRHVFQESTEVGDARRMLLGLPLNAHIPPHHSWRIPNSSQRLSAKLYIHGCPIETFLTKVSIHDAASVMREQQKQIESVLNPAIERDGLSQTIDGDGQHLSNSPLYSSSRVSIWLPTVDTSTAKILLTHRQSVFLEEIPDLEMLKTLCRRLRPEKQSHPITNMYKTFNITADVSRQLVTIFAPYFVDNVCRDLMISFHSKIIPPGCRLYVSEDEAKVAKIRTLRENTRFCSDSAERMELSSVSNRLDLTSTAATRPPLFLRFSSQGKPLSTHVVPIHRRKLKWSHQPSEDGSQLGGRMNVPVEIDYEAGINEVSPQEGVQIRVHSIDNALKDGRMPSTDSEQQNQFIPRRTDDENTEQHGPFDSLFFPNRRIPINVIPEEGSIAGSVGSAESNLSDEDDEQNYCPRKPNNTFTSSIYPTTLALGKMKKQLNILRARAKKNKQYSESGDSPKLSPQLYPTDSPKHLIKPLRQRLSSLVSRHTLADQQAMKTKKKRLPLFKNTVDHSDTILKDEDSNSSSEPRSNEPYPSKIKQKPLPLYNFSNETIHGLPPSNNSIINNRQMLGSKNLHNSGPHHSSRFLDQRPSVPISLPIPSVSGSVSERNWKPPISGVSGNSKIQPLTLFSSSPPVISNEESPRRYTTSDTINTTPHINNNHASKLRVPQKTSHRTADRLHIPQRSVIPNDSSSDILSNSLRKNIKIVSSTSRPISEPCIETITFTGPTTDGQSIIPGSIIPTKNGICQPGFQSLSYPPDSVLYGSQINESLGKTYVGKTSVVSLGVSVRYANAPYAVSKVITFMPRYHFFSRLPFLLLIKDVKLFQSSKLGVGSRAAKQGQSRLILPKGDCLPFHTPETRCILQIPNNGVMLSCPPFSLIPSHVPTTFHVELSPNPSKLLDYDGEKQQQIIQINVVSGNFFEKLGGSALPYTYNGLFFVLSIPEFPHFQIMNFTRFTLQFTSANEKQIHVIDVEENDTARHITKSGRIYRQDKRASGSVTLGDIDAPPVSFSTGKRKLTLLDDTISYDGKPLNPELTRRFIRDSGRTRPSTTSRHPRELLPGKSAVYVPQERGSKISVKLRVVDAKFSSWKVVSLATVQKDPTIISFEKFARQTTTMLSDDTLHANDLQPKNNSQQMSRMTGQDIRDLATLPPLIIQGIQSPSKHIHKDLPSQKHRLYAFLTVDSRGSRILTVTESRRLVAKLRSGQVVNSSDSWKKSSSYKKKYHDTQLVDFNPGLLRSTVYEKQNKSEYEGDVLSQRTAQIPWLAVNFQVFLPKITLTWTSQSEMILALHISSIKFQAFIAPVRLTAFTGGVLKLRDILLSGSDAVRSRSSSTSQADVKQVVLEHKRRSGMLNKLYWGHTGSSEELHDKHHIQTEEHYKQSIYLSQQTTLKDLHKLLETKDPSNIKILDLKLQEWLTQKNKQRQQYMDLHTQIFTNSDIRLEFSVASIHCDHFVEGDIPVIFKSTHSTGADHVHSTPFFLLNVSKSLVDPTFAPIYDDISITISPVSANVELVVVEQLITLGEKEYALIQSAAPIREASRLLEESDVQDEKDEFEQATNNYNTRPLHNSFVNRCVIIHYPPKSAPNIPYASSKQLSGIKMQELENLPEIDLVSKTRLLLPTSQFAKNQVNMTEGNLTTVSSISRPSVSHERFHYPYCEFDGPRIGYTPNPFSQLITTTTTTTTNMQYDTRPQVEFVESLAKAQEIQQQQRGTVFIFPLRQLIQMQEREIIQHAQVKELYKTSLNFNEQPIEDTDDTQLHSITTHMQEMLGAYCDSMNLFHSGSELFDAANPQKTFGLDFRNDAQQAFEKSINVLYISPSIYSHWLVFPNPRWVELKAARPVYIKSLRINAFLLTISIRTSNKRISRQVLHVVDALPLDTPYMGVQINSEKRSYAVCSWGELIHSLRNSYLKQLIRQTLPSAWLFNPLAFATGTWRGGRALVASTVKGACHSRTPERFSLEGGINGFRLGFVMFMLYTVGGIFQTCSHFGNLLHKALGGSRPRPQGVLDAIWKGIDGFFLDTFVTPWVGLFISPATAVSRGDGFCKIIAITCGCLLRCAICVVFGFLNFFTSVTEGFANALIGDFEQFARKQEQSDFLTKSARRLTTNENRLPKPSSHKYGDKFSFPDKPVRSGSVFVPSKGEIASNQIAALPPLAGNLGSSTFHNTRTKRR